MRYPVFIVFILFFCQSIGHSQYFGMSFKDDMSEVDIPFEFSNNFIILEVVLNKSLPLKFIFDTGAEHTILTKKEYAQILGIQFDKRFKIMGTDLETELTAYLARNVQIDLENVRAVNRSLLILEDDYFHFEELTGLQIHGIIGADFFRQFVVKINYSRKIITLVKADKFKVPKKRFVEIPVDIDRNKPYINVGLNLSGNSTMEGKLLVDTGASLSLLLHTDSTGNFTLPPNAIKGNIGAGLGGFLQGFLGRVKLLDVQSFKFIDLVANFQELPETGDSTYLNNRNGILGNVLLSRFMVIIDYPREKMYLKADKKFNKKFLYDRSGLFLVAGGARLKQFIVSNVIPNSPAEEAGLQIGDVLSRINMLPARFYSLSDLNYLFKKKVGKKIKIIAYRGNEKIKFQFRLRDLI